MSFNLIVSRKQVIFKMEERYRVSPEEGVSVWQAKFH